MIVAALLASALAVSEPAASAPPPECDKGPAAVTLARTGWLAYGCKDGRSAALIAAPGNPASPMVFRIQPTAEAFRITGEGRGDRAVVSAAFQELSAMPPQRLRALVLQANGGLDAGR